MTPWFIATEPFTPEHEHWASYIKWSGLHQLTELISLDPMLCPSVLTELKDEYWPHIVNEDLMLDFFVDFDFLCNEVAGVEKKHLLCVFRNPTAAPLAPAITPFEFLGYDLVDIQHSASALTNCGGFPGDFENAELSRFGLLTDFSRAQELQSKLRTAHPEEPHADCHLWAIFRLTM
jgi:hypothetical protein